MEWEYLTIQEMADHLQLNQQTIRNWINDGQLEVVRVGRRIRIPRKVAVKLAGGDGWELPELRTIDQVAELLKLNPQTIRNWIIDGAIPAVYVGERRVRIKQSVLDELLEEGIERLPMEPPPPTASDFWLGDQPVGGLVTPS
jgi:excisionase family DNA binding protein